MAGGYSRALTAFTHPHPRHVTTMVGHRAGYGGYASGYEAAGRVAMSSLSPYSATVSLSVLSLWFHLSLPSYLPHRFSCCAIGSFARLAIIVCVCLCVCGSDS